MFTPTFALQLAAVERAELEAMTRATRIPVGLARRARLILALADGTAYGTITAQLGFAPSSISRWKRRVHPAPGPGPPGAPRAGRPPPVRSRPAGQDTPADPRPAPPPPPP